MAGKLSTYSVFKQMTLKNDSIHFLSQEETEAVQQVLLSMMDDIHRVCRDNGLQYVLTGGCALGAVRHQGFIPWDDDIDVCLPRRDYDRFRQCMLEAFPEKYYIQEVKACKGYDLNFMKVRLNGTVFCEFLDPEPEKSGVFIDVFSIENVSDRPISRKLHRILSDGLQFVCSCIRIRKKKERLLAMAEGSPAAARAIRLKSLLSLPFSLIPFHRWLLWTDRAISMHRDETSSCLAIPAGVRHFYGELCPREWFFPPRAMAFAGREYFVMAEVEKYLTQMYGNYMRIPPVEERERHALAAFSLTGQGESIDVAGESHQS